MSDAACRACMCVMTAHELKLSMSMQPVRQGHSCTKKFCSTLTHALLVLWEHCRISRCFGTHHHECCKMQELHHMLHVCEKLNPASLDKVDLPRPHCCECTAREQFISLARAWQAQSYGNIAALCSMQQGLASHCRPLS